ncbi:acetyltransferase [uncultured Aquimarina sp.]|uniref:acetyltransferase n=1 Tax=uncultured Aquimarina sp. TaxID=575652 RepID=UPI00260A6623|nr:acetyltransferase [uncultured Aquimarina sp.]
MKPLYIVGAGGAAKEIFLLVKEINAVNKMFEFKGFIDLNSNENTLKIGSSFFPILEETTFLETTKENTAIAFGIGDPLYLKKIVSKYTLKNCFNFPNLIHPNVSLDDSVHLGKGNIIASFCVLTVDISLDNFNYINRGVHIGHDTKIGSYNVLNPCSVISGGVNLGDENLVGTNSAILQYLNIGSKNQIGAGAVLTKAVKDNSCFIGIPAKQKK